MPAINNDGVVIRYETAHVSVGTATHQTLRQPIGVTVKVNSTFSDPPRTQIFRDKAHFLEARTKVPLIRKYESTLFTKNFTVREQQRPSWNDWTKSFRRNFILPDRFRMQC
jgi:hypothetical protein